MFENSVGYSLFAAEDFRFEQGEDNELNLGVALKIPAGCYGKLVPTESLRRNDITIIGDIVCPSDLMIPLVISYRGGEEAQGYTICEGEPVALLLLNKAFINVPLVDLKTKGTSLTETEKKKKKRDENVLQLVDTNKSGGERGGEPDNRSKQ